MDDVIIIYAIVGSIFALVLIFLIKCCPICSIVIGILATCIILFIYISDSGSKKAVVDFIRDYISNVSTFFSKQFA